MKFYKNIHTGKDVTFSRFVIQAYEYALKNVEDINKNKND